MRPGQNKRMRGRNNRKGPNPLTRAYESNGPDVKIRGTAQHIAEKYLQLARDAQSSGDPVVAESYLQHAEHYFRIIAAAQAAQQQAHMGYGRNVDDYDDADEEDDFAALPDRFSSPFERPAQAQAFNQPQPQPNMAPANFAGSPQPFIDKPAFASDQQERPDRQGRGDRRFGQQGDRQQGQQRPRFRDQQNRLEPSAAAQEQPRVDFDAVNPGLPAFITSPKRPASPAPFTASDAIVDSPKESGANEVLGQSGVSGLSPDLPSTHEDSESETRFHLRPRRRRRPRPDNTSDENDGNPVAETNSAE
ncbi:DUF4167 domain-containing protein [Rhodoblastus sp.]|uniref:DUF4167 domain-containing protein n=1 Tax=Rhodoblastus sp. TaxID=1962975 RepID=UPI00262DE43E|nr:DUF4167 domain-containing protein [Rhodoblastus sp.]